MKGLDRYITGNWGEDSVPDIPVECNSCKEETYNSCGFIKGVKKSPCELVTKRWEKERKNDLKTYDEMASDYKENNMSYRRSCGGCCGN